MNRLYKELKHLVKLLEPLEQSGGLQVPGLATLNGARAALKEADDIERSRTKQPSTTMSRDYKGHTLTVSGIPGGYAGTIDSLPFRDSPFESLDHAFEEMQEWIDFGRSPK